jgi:hypothetical protein
VAPLRCGPYEQETVVGLTGYLAYVDNELPDHRWASIYLLDHGHSTATGDRLPAL